MHFHHLTEDGSRKSYGETWTGPDFSADWHTFAVDWRPDAVVWYVDGKERWRYTDPAHIPTKPMYLILNLAVGGAWPGSPDASTSFPSYFDIDYVRVWSRPGRVHLSPVADVSVYQDRPGTNDGASDTLYADGSPVKIAYLGFDTTALDRGTVTSAALRITTAAAQGAESPDAQTVKLASKSAWQEHTLTYAHRPAISSDALGTISNTLAGTVYEIPLDLVQLRPHIGTIFSLALDGMGDDGLYFYSRENGFGNPQLILTMANQEAGWPVAVASSHREAHRICLRPALMP
jgi:hypothetical protein